MRKTLKKYVPGTFKFLTEFFEAMNNRKGGHSLRKWLAVGFYWLMWLLSLEFTTPENLVAVLTIHAGMITALIITYTAGNIQQQKIDNNIASKEEATEETA